MRGTGTLLLTGTLLAVNGQQSPPRFEVKVDLVQVDVQVTRRGRPVGGLTAGDFELRDNGVVQRIETVTREEVPLDLFLVLDTSASVAGEPLRALTDAARIAAQALGASDRASLMTFNHRLSEPARLSTDRRVVVAAIEKLAASGGTSLFDAVYAALVRRGESKHRALVIAFTDGYDSSSWLLPSAVLDVARQTDAVVYAVTLSPDASLPDTPVFSATRDPVGGPVVVTRPAHPYRPPAFLTEIASITGGRLFHTADPRKLRDLFEQAVREMKTRYVLSYTPQGIPRGGWHALDVKLTRGRGDVIARRGYFVPGER